MGYVVCQGRTDQVFEIEGVLMFPSAVSGQGQILTPGLASRRALNRGRSRFTPA